MSQITELTKGKPNRSPAPTQVCLLPTLIKPLSFISGISLELHRSEISRELLNLDSWVPLPRDPDSVGAQEPVILGALVVFFQDDHMIQICRQVWNCYLVPP